MADPASAAPTTGSGNTYQFSNQFTNSSLSNTAFVPNTSSGVVNFTATPAPATAAASVPNHVPSHAPQQASQVSQIPPNNANNASNDNNASNASNAAQAQPGAAGDAASQASAAAADAPEQKSSSNGTTGTGADGSGDGSGDGSAPIAEDAGNGSNGLNESCESCQQSGASGVNVESDEKGEQSRGATAASTIADGADGVNGLNASDEASVASAANADSDEKEVQRRGGTGVSVEKEDEVSEEEDEDVIKEEERVEGLQALWWAVLCDRVQNRADIVKFIPLLQLEVSTMRSELEETRTYQINCRHADEDMIAFLVVFGKFRMTIGNGGSQGLTLTIDKHEINRYMSDCSLALFVIDTFVCALNLKKCGYYDTLKRINAIKEGKRVRKEWEKTRGETIQWHVEAALKESNLSGRDEYALIRIMAHVVDIYCNNFEIIKCTGDVNDLKLWVDFHECRAATVLLEQLNFESDMDGHYVCKEKLEPEICVPIHNFLKKEYERVTRIKKAHLQAEFLDVSADDVVGMLDANPRVSIADITGVLHKLRQAVQNTYEPIAVAGDDYAKDAQRAQAANSGNSASGSGEDCKTSGTDGSDGIGGIDEYVEGPVGRKRRRNEGFRRSSVSLSQGEVVVIRRDEEWFGNGGNALVEMADRADISGFDLIKMIWFEKRNSTPDTKQYHHNYVTGPVGLDKIKNAMSFLQKAGEAQASEQDGGHGGHRRKRSRVSKANDDFSDILKNLEFDEQVANNECNVSNNTAHKPHT